jgi:hypothetical protein
MILIELHSNKMGKHDIKVTMLILIHLTMNWIKTVEWLWDEQRGCKSWMLEIYRFPHHPGLIQ